MRSNMQGCHAATKMANRHEFKTSGIGWDRDKIVVAEIREVNAASQRRPLDSA